MTSSVKALFFGGSLSQQFLIHGGIGPSDRSFDLRDRDGLDFLL